MSIHLGAKFGDIAENVLLPGDPLRAKYIADKFLDHAVLYNEVRGMFGFTGTYKGKPVSVQGTGMGIPSISIYVHELIHDYGAKRLLRVGTCGSLQKHVHVRDVILALSASTDSSFNKNRFDDVEFSPSANFELLRRAYDFSCTAGINVHVGNVLTSDTFYNDTPGLPKVAQFGTLAVEMETAALYTLAAKFGVQALSLLTVSDHLITKEETTAQERQSTFDEMILVALEIF